MTLTLIKIGGSLITNKQVESSFRPQIADQIANEIAAALKANPALPLIVGHGSGSFGHFAAKRYGTIEGVHTTEQWFGFTEVARVAAELNALVANTMHSKGLVTWRVQPSASIVCRDAIIQAMALQPLQAAITGGVIPLVYGDVAIDTVRGGTIASTETIFTYLVQNLPVSRVLILGEVAGVYDADGRIIPEITPASLASIRHVLGGSAGTDVTGGMLTKVQDMVALVEQVPGLKVWIMDGTQPENLRQALLEESQFGTLIHAGQSNLPAS